MPDGVSLILCVCLTIVIALVVVGRSRTGFQASRLYVLGKQRYQEGQYAEAERLFRTAVEMREQALGRPGFRPNGYAVAAHLRQQDVCRDTIIIAVTGYGQEDDRRRSRESGIDHHLLKPVSSGSLLPLLSRSGTTSCAGG